MNLSLFNLAFKWKLGPPNSWNNKRNHLPENVHDDRLSVPHALPPTILQYASTLSFHLKRYQPRLSLNVLDHSANEWVNRAIYI